MGHEALSGATVPVLLIRRCPDCVSSAKRDDGAIAVYDQADAFGAVERLPDGVGVPVGSGARRKANEAGDQARCALLLLERRDVDVAGEGGVRSLGSVGWRD